MRLVFILFYCSENVLFSKRIYLDTFINTPSHTRMFSNMLIRKSTMCATRKIATNILDRSLRYGRPLGVIVYVLVRDVILVSGPAACDHSPSSSRCDHTYPPDAPSTMKTTLICVCLTLAVAVHGFGVSRNAVFEAIIREWACVFFSFNILRLKRLNQFIIQQNTPVSISIISWYFIFNLFLYALTILTCLHGWKVYYTGVFIFILNFEIHWLS